MAQQIIYVASGDVSVYESQVLELLAYYQKKGVKVFLLQGYMNDNQRNSIEYKLSKYSIPVYWVKSYSVYPIFQRQAIVQFYHGLIKIPNYKESTIHIRSEYSGFLFKKLLCKYNLNIPLLIDIRGVVYEEIKYKMGRSMGLRKWLFMIQKNYLRRCYQFLFSEDNMPICISSVSNKINEYIQNHYPNCRYKLYFHPNIAGKHFVYDELKRVSIRTKYGIAKNEVLAICATGGNSLWQQDFRVIKHLLNLGIKVINLSRNDYGISDCITTTVPFAEMPDMLSAADIAVLWREGDFINQSASPSKFSEFASMGLYVIHNGTVQVATDYIQFSNNGCIVRNADNISVSIINTVKQLNRVESIKSGKATFGVEAIGISYLKCLGF